MAIDLGALTGTASGAEPKTTSKSGKSDADFSRTLTASRQSRAHAEAPARTSGAAQQRDTDQASPSGRDDATPPSQRARSSQTNPKAAADTAQKPNDDSDNADGHYALTHQRLSPVSLVAERSKTTAASRAAESAPTSSQAKAGAPGDPATTLPTTGSQPGDVRSNKTSTRNDPDASPDDSSHRHKTDASTPDPVAALIQPPLLAAGVIKSNGPSHAAVDDAASGGSSSPSGGLQLSWRQLFARLDGDARNGQSNNQAGGQAADGSDPAQLLAALTAGKSGTRDRGDTDNAVRFGILHGTGQTDGGRGNSSPTTSAGHAPNTSTSVPTAGTGPANGTPVSTTLSAPLASDNWNSALGQQTLRLAGAGQNQAQIQLHPRELGQINISLTVNDHNQAQIHFAAAHTHVRDAVEAALPQLRQSLAAGGLSLGQASVGDQNSQAAFANDDGRPGRRDQPLSGEAVPVAGATVDTGSAASSSHGTSQIGGIDIFA